MLARTRVGKVLLRSPAYPDRVFEGVVVYGGDMVEEQSRAIKLLAQADNPGRLLKPGMFVEVEVVSPGEGTVARIPASALLTEGSTTHVYVRGGPDVFHRREVVSEPPRGGMVSIVKGLEPGDEVVIAGGFKLKSLAIRMASSAG
jgi:multidrug efflux pump subunit AcrA (membrane-fusion protein)